jgi:hypothetical protein
VREMGTGAEPDKHGLVDIVSEERWSETHVTL